MNRNDRQLETEMLGCNPGNSTHVTRRSIISYIESDLSKISSQKWDSEVPQAKRLLGLQDLAFAPSRCVKPQTSLAFSS